MHSSNRLECDEVAHTRTKSQLYCKDTQAFKYNPVPLPDSSRSEIVTEATRLDKALVQNGWAVDRAQDTTKTIAASIPTAPVAAFHGGGVPFHKNIGDISCNLEVRFSGPTDGVSPGVITINRSRANKILRILCFMHRTIQITDLVVKASYFSCYSLYDGPPKSLCLKTTTSSFCYHGSMKPYILGLCGGSGSGKSTLAFGLADMHPGEVTVFHLDDYFRPREEVLTLHGFVNYDDPRALNSDKMIADLATLISGKPVTINTKSPRLNPDYVKTRQRVPVRFEPNKLIVVEGFLTLYFEELRKHFDYSIYLDAPFDDSTGRRAGEKINNYSPEYFKLVLKPMSERYVYPNKKYASRVVNIEGKSKQYVLNEVEEILNSQSVF